MNPCRLACRAAARSLGGVTLAVGLTCLAGCGGKDAREAQPGGPPAQGGAASSGAPAPRNGAPGAGASGAGRVAQTPVAGAVALVNGEAISEQDYAATLREATFLAKQATFKGRREVADRMIDTLLTRQAAVAAGYRDNRYVRLEAGRTRRRLAAAALQRRLAKEIGALKDAEVEAAVGTLARVADVVAILVDTREEAEALRTKIFAGEDMLALRAQSTIAPVSPGSGATSSRVVEGGSMYPADVERRIFSLAPGEVSEPLETPVGWAVVKLLKLTEPSPEQRRDARFAAQRTLLQERLQARLREVTDKGRAEGAVRIVLPTVTRASFPSVEQQPSMLYTALEDAVVARMGEAEVTFIDLFGSQITYRAFLNTGDLTLQQEYDARLQTAVDQLLVAAEAARLGLDKTPEVDAAVDRVVQMMIGELYARDLGRELTPDKLNPERCDAFFEEQRKRYTAKERAQVAEILVRRQEQAVGVDRDLEAGKDFAAIARERSFADNASSGGELPLLDEEGLAARFGAGGAAAVMKAARDGKPRVTVRGQDGYRIVAIRRFLKAGEGTAADAGKPLQDDCLAVARGALVRERVAALRAAATIWVDEAKIATIAPAGAPTSFASPHGGRAPSPAGGGTSPHGGTGASPHGGGGGSPHGGMGSGRGMSPHGGTARP